MTAEREQDVPLGGHVGQPLAERVTLAQYTRIAVKEEHLARVGAVVGALASWENRITKDTIDTLAGGVEDVRDTCTRLLSGRTAIISSCFTEQRPPE